MKKQYIFFRIKDFLGLKKDILALLSTVILIGMGEHLAERFLPIYLICLGGGAVAVGGLNALDNFLSAIYSFPGGYLTDKFGYKKSLIIFNIFAMIGYIIVIFIKHWSAVLIGACFFISWSAISLPATMSLISNVLSKDKQVMGVSMHSCVRRVPMGLGPIIGGLFITVWGQVIGIRVAFVFALLLAIIALAIQQKLITENHKISSFKTKFNLIQVVGKMSPQLKKLLISDILIRFCEQIPYAFVVVWCVNVMKISELQFGFLTAIEMATAIVIYVPVAFLVNKFHKKPFVLITYGFFTIFPIVLWFSRSIWWLIIAFIIRGLKEFGEPTRKSLIMDLADDEQKSTMFGAYYLVRDVIVSIAAFGGAFLWKVSPQTNFIVAFVFGLIGFLFFWVFGSDDKRDIQYMKSC